MHSGRTKSSPTLGINFVILRSFGFLTGGRFRYDMAEMVPIEFWSYLNSTIKIHNPEAILVAEVYQPERYRDYLHLGKMDYLYDKVDLYDSLKGIIQSKESTQEISRIQQK